MTLTSDQLKTVIIELGVLENPIIDIKVMKLAHSGVVPMGPGGHRPPPPKYFQEIKIFLSKKHFAHRFCSKTVYLLWLTLT